MNMTDQPPRWALLDFSYGYLDDGYTFTLTTDVPCHLFCRMTKEKPLTHPIPVLRRGTLLRTDVRFCFVVYEDNEQQEPGDTLTHTFIKDNWPICETRWCYFWGTIAGQTSPSETAIFKFHFPAPPPPPPPPRTKTLAASTWSKSMSSTHALWPRCWQGSNVKILDNDGPPYYQYFTETELVATYWIFRTFLDFGPLRIPLTSKIVSAYMRFWPVWKMHTSSATYNHVFITKGLWTLKPTELDWEPQNHEYIIGGEIQLPDIIINRYNIINLLPAGLSWLKPQYDLKLCIREEMDVLNSPPPLGTNGVRYLSAYHPLYFCPELVVSYYPA